MLEPNQEKVKKTAGRKPGRLSYDNLGKKVPLLSLVAPIRRAVRGGLALLYGCEPRWRETG